MNFFKKLGAGLTNTICQPCCITQLLKKNNWDDVSSYGTVKCKILSKIFTVIKIMEKCVYTSFGKGGK